MYTQNQVQGTGYDRCGVHACVWYHKTMEDPLNIFVQPILSISRKIMDGVLAGLAFATALNDAMEVWDKIVKSFTRVSQNRRGAQRLVREIGNDLDILKDLYEDHHETLDKSTKTETAIRTLIENMEQALGTCAQLLPPVSEKRFSKYTLKYYAWKNGSKIEEELLDLKSRVSECRHRFNTLAIARVEIQTIEHQQVTVSGNWTLQNMLSDLTVASNRLRAFDRSQQSGISPSIVIDIPDEYLKIILRTISKTVSTMTSLYTLMFVVNMKKPTVEGIDHYLFPHDRDLLHRDAVAFALDIQHDFKYSLTISTYAIRIVRLTRMVRRLGLFQEAERMDWRTMCTAQIKDTFRPMRGSMVWAMNQEILQRLYILDRKVDLVFRFCERHVDALEISEPISRERDKIYNSIYRFYYCHQFDGPSVERIKEEIENLESFAVQIHDFDRRLPPLYI